MHFKGKEGGERSQAVVRAFPELLHEGGVPEPDVALWGSSAVIVLARLSGHSLGLLTPVGVDLTLTLCNASTIPFTFCQFTC